jgi:hypothetical protein
MEKVNLDGLGEESKKIVEKIMEGNLETFKKDLLAAYIEAGEPEDPQEWYKQEWTKHSGWPSIDELDRGMLTYHFLRKPKFE